jgi:hypothetical protein
LWKEELGHKGKKKVLAVLPWTAIGRQRRKYSSSMNL